MDEKNCVWADMMKCDGSLFIVIDSRRESEGEKKTRERIWKL